ncbi:glycosyltransferase family 2 protein [Actinomadura sp. 6K520]|uniref:glycosyltransferase family 2 protein n=1 Tax=Actinomadura sp. 6K520 TaxID=2530364 RepID=UPI0010485A8D|nr:glycosyltransferase family 2 protein [Actinomadura sp. 6K520]TDE25237.1 glycosyltransferase family 2 protein [Actinomadura sp. 6K520]
MAEKLVSVVMPVYNGRDTVGRALESVFAQTLPAEEIEVVVVDDGSTDGTGALLDELARAHGRLTVIHQANSGGCGAPRNRGLERASGRFVFFLDADDRLGPEALERMTAMAERHDTDIVLGKQVGTGGRRVPKRVFARTIERTHVLDPDCDLFPQMSMASLQLFRRSLIDRAGLRFVEGVLSHEDQLFTAGAYLHARAVSVLADYDCYYWDARADGTSNTQLGGAAPAEVHAIAGRAMALVAEHTEPGEIREKLLYRYLLLEVFVLLEQRYLGSSGEERETILKGCRELTEPWLTPGLLARYQPRHRILAHCLLRHLDAELAEVLRFHRSGQRPGIHLEGGRAYLKYPFFRDAAAAIPDACFETDEPPVFRHDLVGLAWDGDALVVSGRVRFRDVDEGAPVLDLVLEDAAGAGRRVRCEAGPAERTDEGLTVPHTARFLPAECPDGRWSVRVEAALGGHVFGVPVLKPRGMTVPRAALGESGGRWRLVRPLPLPKGERGRLVLAVGAELTPADLRNVEIGFGTGGRLRVAGEPPPVLSPGPPPGMSVLLGHRDGRVVRTPLVIGPDRRRRHAEVPLAGVRSGHWRTLFQIDGIGAATPVRGPEGGGVLGPVTVSALPPRRAHVRLDREPPAVHVALPLAARARRMWRHLAGRFGAVARGGRRTPCACRGARRPSRTGRGPGSRRRCPTASATGPPGRC